MVTRGAGQLPLGFADVLVASQRYCGLGPPRLPLWLVAGNVPLGAGGDQFESTRARPRPWTPFRASLDIIRVEPVAPRPRQFACSSHHWRLSHAAKLA